MQEDKEKQAICNLLQLGGVPALDHEFEGRLVERWLVDTPAKKDLISIQIETRTLKCISHPRWWALGIACSLAIGGGYWKHQRELEELRQFDVVMEFSMGSL